MNYQKQRIVWNSSKSGGLILGGWMAELMFADNKGLGWFRQCDPHSLLNHIVVIGCLINWTRIDIFLIMV